MGFALVRFPIMESVYKVGLAGSTMSLSLRERMLGRDSHRGICSQGLLWYGTQEDVFVGLALVGWPLWFSVPVILVRSIFYHEVCLQGSLW